MLFSRKAVGDRGEDQAVTYLKKKKYKIIERNVHLPPGEIDIVAMQDTSYIFIEVKYRTTDLYGKGFEAVDHRKQERIRRAAILYCQQKKIEALCRFDVISIDGTEITHIENAF